MLMKSKPQENKLHRISHWSTFAHNMSQARLLGPAGSGSPKDPGAENGHGFLGKYPHPCLCVLSASPVFICAPEHRFKHKLEPHDSL